MSQRRACRLAQISAKAIRYVAKPNGDEALIARLKSLGEQYPRYGYLMLHAMMRSEGLVRNRKRTYRIYSDLGMQVRTRRRKKLIRPRIPMALPMILFLELTHVYHIFPKYSGLNIKLPFGDC